MESRKDKPTLNEHDSSGEEQEISEDEEGTDSDVTPQPRKRAKRLLEEVQEDQEEREEQDAWSTERTKGFGGTLQPTRDPTPQPAPFVNPEATQNHVFRKPPAKSPPSNPPSETRVFRKPVANSQSETWGIRKPTPKSPAVISKAMLQMDALVPISPAHPAKPPLTKARTNRPDYSLDKIIVADEYEDVKLNCNEK